MGEEVPMDHESTIAIKKRGRSLSLSRSPRSTRKSTRYNNNNGQKSDRFQPNALGYDENDFPILPLPTSTSSSASAAKPKRARRQHIEKSESNFSGDQEGHAAQLQDIGSRDSSLASKRSTHSIPQRHNNPGSSGNNNIQNSNLKPKPVFVETGYAVLNHYIPNVNFSERPLMKLLGHKEVKVICATVADKTKLLKMLKEKALSYHTFTEPTEKPFIYVLKDVQKTFTPEEITAALLEKSLPVTKTTFLVDKPGKDVVHLVHFTRTSNSTLNLSFIQHRAKHINNLIVRWERFDRSHKRISQCHNCQLFGHTASQCGRPRRCVKCLDNHEPQMCLRKSKDQEGTPKCVNCQGDHPANSPTCQHHINYREKINKTRAIRQQIQQNVSQRQQVHRIPLTQAYPGPKPNSFANAVSNNLNLCTPMTQSGAENSLAKFSNLNARIANIQGIHETLDRFEKMVSELESAPIQQHQAILWHYLAPRDAY